MGGRVGGGVGGGVGGEVGGWVGGRVGGRVVGGGLVGDRVVGELPHFGGQVPDRCRHATHWLAPVTGFMQYEQSEYRSQNMFSSKPLLPVPVQQPSLSPSLTLGLPHDAYPVAQTPCLSHSHVPDPPLPHPLLPCPRTAAAAMTSGRTVHAKHSANAIASAGGQRCTAPAAGCPRDNSG